MAGQIPPQFLKAAAAKRLGQSMPAAKKPAGPPQLKKKMVVEKETPESAAIENEFLQKNPSKQTPADKKSLAAAASRKLGA